MGQQKFYIVSVGTVFGLNLVSTHFSDFPEVVKIYMFSKLSVSSSCEILHPT
jgi:hypothetical protein